ncbi:MAG: acyl-CoA dehydratase activase [Bacillota bacterium]
MSTAGWWFNLPGTTGLFLGIDIGSVYAKALAIDNEGNNRAAVLRPTGLGGAKLANELRLEVIEKAGSQLAFTVATGYGRVNVPFADKTLTEISCHARGINHIYPQARVVVDIGGQDSKVIVLGPKGQVEDFVMNDKCAAGTGRFLDVMARALEVDVSDLGRLHDISGKRLEISSTCTVFAESEVISLLANGEEREDVIAGIHRAIVNRVFSLLKGRLGKQVPGPVVLTGGVARNEGILKALTEKMGSEVLVPPEPQFTGALGAAIIARELAG